MNGWILDFARKHRGKFSGEILEVGSYDVNGALRSMLPITVGTDMREGPGVDKVISVSDLLTEYGPESFDHVCSADALEHIEDWDAALVNMWGILKPGGYLFLTMAHPKKGRHGYPHDYHRLGLSLMAQIFAGNEVLDTFEGGPSQGVLVRKQTPSVDLTIRPKPVR
jgi:2-polyprenyl-3-methyl-5-hydroxy-6-metoxy-1,4-benzoquinol methylase